MFSQAVVEVDRQLLPFYLINPYHNVSNKKYQNKKFDSVIGHTAPIILYQEEEIFLSSSLITTVIIAKRRHTGGPPFMRILFSRIHFTPALKSLRNMYSPYANCPGHKISVRRGFPVLDSTLDSGSYHVANPNYSIPNFNILQYLYLQNNIPQTEFIIKRTQMLETLEDSRRQLIAQFIRNIIFSTSNRQKS